MKKEKIIAYEVVGLEAGAPLNASDKRAKARAVTERVTALAKGISNQPRRFKTTRAKAKTVKKLNKRPNLISKLENKHI